MKIMTYTKKVTQGNTTKTWMLCCFVGFFKIFEALLLLTRTKTHISSFDYSGIMNYNHE